MKTIRRNVFETNSSSTHSISIYKRNPIKKCDIPKDCDFEIVGEIVDDRIEDELGKLKYIICLLSTVYQHKYDYEYMKELDFSEMIELNQFRWLKEIIKDKCNSNMTYKLKRSSECFPYYETTYDEHSSPIEIFENIDCNIEDENSFKSKIAEIIFNEEYVIDDMEEEY